MLTFTARPVQKPQTASAVKSMDVLFFQHLWKNCAKRLRESARGVLRSAPRDIRDGFGKSFILKGLTWSELWISGRAFSHESNPR